MKKIGLFFLISVLIADEQTTHRISFEGKPAPAWFTGPLIAPTGYTADPGHVNIQPLFDAFVNLRNHNFYMYRVRLRLKTGVTQWMDVQITPRALYQETRGKHAGGFGDMRFGVNFQLLGAGLDDPWPAIKLMLQAWAPFGKYQKLSPHKDHTDALGTGSWYPQAGVVFSKMWHLTGIHYFEARFYGMYAIGTPVSVKGINFYGGDPTTRGTAYAGNILYTDIAIQYNMTRNWAVACDLNYQHQNSSRFSGRTIARSTIPSFDVLSLAPAIEYNWSQDLGVIGGVWFSMARRATPRFVRGILSLNSYF